MSTPILNADLVRYVASLVQIGITDEEAELFAPQLSAILEYFTLLQEVDTEAVEPAFLLPGLRNVLREDRKEPSMKREEFLRNVPRSTQEYVSVPAVLED
ncbi:MAG: Asp-tRNA(Asn)/Glu-tRNA(Gln) amidotransferase subunit GatC [Anaerolineales bacterium]|nr:Asp-tRNA(Asn)/Glu-tRNA(Gln) amidotransferase subunit GatC [Chthoniobacterales bacterium]MCX7608236.1 Asp-tRNA(Asn)/Glu-tRNA(Gln) amidotransferase subunit GatC [Anaerolineales bacterium]